MKKVCILTSAHKRSEIFTGKTVMPIQVGTEINGIISEFELHDNTGDNISDKNRMYCEITAQYWAWKNLDADYYGFMHYRRYFSFNPKPLQLDRWGNIVYQRITQDALAELNYSDEAIEKALTPYDILSVEPQNVHELDGSGSVYDHYKTAPHHRISDLDTVIDIINEKYPEYSVACRSYLAGRMGYFCNMYILRKEVFQTYCAWMFDILKEHERRTDLSDYDINEYRVSGFLAERLWGIFYTRAKQEGRLKCHELQKSYFVDTQPAPDIHPAFEKNSIPVVIAADDKYVPYVTVMLRSVIENGSPENNYDFIVLHSSITKKHQLEIKREFADSKNFSVRFCNVAYLYSGLDLKTHFHITVETYYRLLMQDIMKNYDKVLYIDSDLVVLDDLADLYHTDMEGYCLAAVKDIDMAGNYHRKDPVRTEYFKKTLTIADPYDYFNAGVLVMNLKEFRKQFSTRSILDKISMHEWMYMDQDILNYMCEGKTKYLDMTWNVVMNWETDTDSRMNVMCCAPHGMYLEYLESRKHPKIVHYAGFQKPWDLPECDMAEYFWKYAEQTGIYQLLLDRLTSAMESQSLPAVKNGNPYQLAANGLNESIFIDGMYVKMINKLNKMFPLNSKRRERLKRIARMLLGS